MKKAVIIYNKKSGRTRKSTLEFEAVQKLTSLGYVVRVEYTASSGAKPIIERYKDNCDLYVIIGGDGTIGQAVSGLVKNRLSAPVSIIPKGTVNDFARVLGIPLSPHKAVQNFTGETMVKADIIRRNDDYAGYLVALGDFMQSFASVSSARKNRFGRLSYLWIGLKTFATMKSFHVSISGDGFSYEGPSLFTLVTTMRSVGSLTRLVDDAKIDDGNIHILNILPVNTKEIIEIVTLALTGSIDGHPKVTLHQAESVSITSPDRHEINVDGDAHPYRDLSLQVITEQIDILI